MSTSVMSPTQDIEKVTIAVWTFCSASLVHQKLCWGEAYKGRDHADGHISGSLWPIEETQRTEKVAEKGSHPESHLDRLTS